MSSFRTHLSVVVPMSLNDYVSDISARMPDQYIVRPDFTLASSATQSSGANCIARSLLRRSAIRVGGMASELEQFLWSLVCVPL
jgi:uncharacterized protein (UPF0261 family)